MQRLTAPPSSESLLVEGADVESRAAIPEVKASPGRPDITALLRQICAEHQSEQEIGVVAAGKLSP